MKEPNIEKQVKDAQEQYKDLLITEDELNKQLDRISYHYDLWLKNNK